MWFPGNNMLRCYSVWPIPSPKPMRSLLETSGPRNPPEKMEIKYVREALLLRRDFSIVDNWQWRIPYSKHIFPKWPKCKQPDHPWSIWGGLFCVLCTAFFIHSLWNRVKNRARLASLQWQLALPWPHCRPMNKMGCTSFMGWSKWYQPPRASQKSIVYRHIDCWNGTTWPHPRIYNDLPYMCHIF